jgi:hypothetical protein
LIVRGVWTSYNYLTSEEYNTDLTVGGILDVRMFTFPEMPKQALYKFHSNYFRKWVMRNVFSVEDRLKIINYPDPTQSA